MFRLSQKFMVHRQ